MSQAELDALVASLESLLEADYEPVSWGTFIVAKSAAFLLPETSEAAVVDKIETLREIQSHVLSIVPISNISPLVPVTSPSYIVLD